MGIMSFSHTFHSELITEEQKKQETISRAKYHQFQDNNFFIPHHALSI
jgi:hypothetical protein